MWVVTNVVVRASRAATRRFTVVPDATPDGGIGSPRRRRSAPMGARTYTRDPREAERLAGTVAGHRAERARRERLQREADPVHSRRRRGSKFSRAWRVWNETPLKWTPLPVLLGAIVLVGVQAHRQWEHNHRIEPVVDASGEPVRTRGPWSVRGQSSFR